MNDTGTHAPEEAAAPPPIRLEIAEATPADIRAALSAGIGDLARRPVLSVFFGAVPALLGIVMIGGLLVFDQIWMVVSAGVAFPLVAPFLAAGLYEMSRRMRRGESYTATDILLVIFRQQRREFGWMAFVTLFVFWIWAYQVRLLLAIFLQWESFSTLGELATILSSTGAGAMFLGVGTLVGAFLATVLFTITVVSMPLLLDKNVDFVTAMITSIKAVGKSPRVMLAWGAVIGAMTLISIAPAFIGLIFVFPVLGHATWHLYERLVTEAGDS